MLLALLLFSLNCARNYAIFFQCANTSTKLLQNKPENANYASSAFFRKKMKFALVMANYAKTCASIICQSLSLISPPLELQDFNKSPHPLPLQNHGKPQPLRSG